MSKSVHNLLLILVAFVGGIGVTVYGALLVLDAYASSYWATTVGTITSSGVISTRGNKSGTDYRVEANFDFVVQGKSYHAENWSFNDPKFNTRSEAELIVRGYNPGSEVVVYYDPENPSNAVLEPGVGFFTFTYLLFGGALLLLGCYLTFRRIRLNA